MGRVGCVVLAIAGAMTSACSLERVPDNALWFERFDPPPTSIFVTSGGDVITVTSVPEIGLRIARRAGADGTLLWETGIPAGSIQVDPAGDIFATQGATLLRYDATNGELISERPITGFAGDWRVRHGVIAAFTGNLDTLTLFDAASAEVLWIVPDIIGDQRLDIAANGDVFILNVSHRGSPPGGVSRYRRVDGSLAWRNSELRSRFMVPLPDGGVAVSEVSAAGNSFVRLDAGGVAEWVVRSGPSFDACCGISGIAATTAGDPIVLGYIGEHRGQDEYTMGAPRADGAFGGHRLDGENASFVAELSASTGTTRRVGQFFDTADALTAGAGGHYFVLGGFPDSWLAGLED